MIVNSLKDGWEIIYQRAHANLAAMLLAAYAKDEAVIRQTELTIAVAQHDDQEMFWEQSVHLTDLGAPMDFTQGTMTTTVEQVPRVIANAHRQGLFIALMISMHNSTLYEGQRGSDPALDALLDQQRENQQKWRKELKITAKQAKDAYAVLLWADSLSLILCRRHLPIQSRKLEIAPTHTGEMVRVWQREDETIGLEPWVFEEDEMRFSLEMRRLEQLHFTSEADFITALDNAHIEIQEWVFRK